jgi:predicted nucleic acid-binding protein
MDTSVSLPATLSPGGMARKLWVLLALGALTHRIEHHRLALEELRAEGEVTGALSGALEIIEAEANYLISDDHDIVPDGSEHTYEYDEHQVLAVTFNRFITTYFEPPDLDWSAIDGRWLQHAFEDDTTATTRL